MSNKVNYRASNTRLRYQLVLSALVFCLGATYGVKELKIPGVLTFKLLPNVQLILLAISSFSFFTFLSFGVQYSLYKLEYPHERKEINEYRRGIDKEISTIKSHFKSAIKKLDQVVDAYSNLVAEELKNDISKVRIIFDSAEEESKLVDPNLVKVREFADELRAITASAYKIENEKFMWEELFGGQGALNKAFLIANKNVGVSSKGLTSVLIERRIEIDKIRTVFDEFSEKLSKLEERHKKFKKALKSFSDARWLDRYGLPFLIPVLTWVILMGVGLVNFYTPDNETNKSTIEQQTIPDEMSKT